MSSRGRTRNLSILPVLLLAIVCAVPQAASAAAVPSLGPGGPLPLAFEPNRGQADPTVKFLARGPGYGLFFAPNETVLVLAPPQARTLGHRPGSPPAPKPPSVVRMRLLGADPAAALAGLDPRPGRTHYLVGDRGRWVRDIPTFARIRYTDVYPGVSLVFYGTERQLEYDFVVAPGADADLVALSFEGADGLRLDDAGDLVLTTSGGELRLRRPLIYEEHDGERRPLEGGFIVDGNRVRFRVVGRDARRALVIDPVLGYSAFLGGAAIDQGFGVAFDTTGNAYVTGSTASANFPLTPTAAQRTLGGTTDAFVTKVDPSGTVLYSTYLGGAGDDVAHAIAVDGTGNAYVTGLTTSSDFPIVGPFQPTPQGGREAFVTKLDVNGSSLVYSSYLGGDGEDLGFGVAVDASGNAYVAGSTGSATFPNNNAITCGGSRSGPTDAFVARVNTTGSALDYCTFVGGSGDDSAAAIAADGAGNVWIAGSTTSPDLAVVSAAQARLGGGTDGFVSKLDTAGAVAYLTYLGGAAEDHATAIAVDAVGNAYVTGSTTSTNFPTAAALQPALAGSTDAFVTKLTATGDAFTFSTYLGGTDADVGNGIAVNLVDSTVYVAGSTRSTDFPIQDPIQDRPVGGLDAFLSKLEPTGGAFVYSTYLGGAGDDAALAVAVDTNGVAVLSGTTSSATFPVSSGTLAGGVDAFVTQIGDGGIIQFTGTNYQVAEDGGSVTISVQRTGDVTAQVKVDYLTSDGTATAGADYLPAAGTLTFAPGQIIATFTVTIVDDTIGDGDETVTLTLRNPGGGAVLGTRRTSTLTIVENEPAINFSAATYNVDETKGPAVVTVIRSGPAVGTVTVRVTTSDGTATALADYTPVNTTITFAPGVRSVNVPVPITNDTLAEGTETLNVTLSNVSGGTPAALLGVRSSATINILDDDRGGTIQFSKPSFTVNEPAAGTIAVPITVTRAGGMASNVTVDYAISDGAGPDAASNGKNYVGSTGTLTFGAGQTTLTFTVTVRSDGAATGDLSAILSLSKPGGGAVLGSTRTAELRIVDGAPRFSFGGNGFVVKEGTPTATITVIRTGPTTAAATVDYTTSDGSATAGVDYQAVAGTLTFPAGAASRTFTVPILNNTAAAGSRTVVLTIGNPTPATMSIVPPAQATLTIVDDDSGGLIAFAGPAFVGAQPPAGPARITVARTGGTAGGVTVDFATSNGTAVAGTDYVATGGTLTFAPGETTKTFDVTILTPPTVAGVRTVNLALSTPTGGATLGARTTAVLRIIDNLSIAFSSASYSVAEGGTAIITVELTGKNLVTPVTVDFTASDGSGRQGIDYRATSGTLTFPVGGTDTSVRTRTFTVPALPNTLADGTKTVNLTLSNATGGGTIVTAPVNRSTAVLTITDDDQAGSVAFDAAVFSVSETAGAAVIRVRRTAGNASNVTVDYATSDGTAASGLRYQPASGRLTFAALETVQTFTVPIINDAVGTGPQTVKLTLSNAGGGATLGGQTTAVLTIQDDEPYVALSAATYAVGESAGSLTVTVSRGGDLSRQATIDYATVDQTPASTTRAVAGIDYIATSGTLTFAPTQTTATFTVPIVNNSLPQADRTFVVTLSNPAITGLPPATLALIAPAAAVVTIKDEDIGGSIQLSAPTYTVNEDGGEAVVTITRTAGRAGGVSVRVQTGDLFPPPPSVPAQTATAGVDYTSTDVRVTFGPGDTTKTVKIPILTDALAEGHETLYVKLSDAQPTGASRSPVIGAQSLATITIVDAQPTVQLAFATYTATEGQPVATVTVQRTAPAGRLSVDFATSDDTATAPAYYLRTAGTLVFEAGVTSQSFTVPLVDNQAIEVDTAFNVTLSNLVALTPAAAGTTLGPRTTAAVKIKEDDRGGMFSVTGGVIQEGAPSQNSVFLATVSRTGGSGGPVTLRFTVDECGAFGSPCKFPARAGVDFDPINTTLTFQPGETRKTISVIVHGNDVPEGSRNFQLALGLPSPSVMQDGLQIGPQITGGEALVHIDEDDLYFVNLSAERYGALEGSREIAIPIIRSGLPNYLANSLTIDVIAVATTAVLNQDYVSIGVFDGMSSLNPTAPGGCSGLFGFDLVARQNVVFAPNQVSQTFRVPFLDDTIVDGNKGFFICINDAERTGTPGGPGVTFPAAAGLIVTDDDNGGTIQFGADTYVVAENAAQAIITLVRSGSPNFASDVTVVAKTGDLFPTPPNQPAQTGRAGTDYASTNTTVTFNVGETTATFAVPLLNDGAADGGRTVYLEISSPQPVGFPGSPTLGQRRTALLLITDVTQSVDFTLSNYDVGESAGQAVITLERGGDVSAPLTVDFTTSDDTAIAGTHYGTPGSTTPPSTTVTFAAGSRTATVTVPIIDNKVVTADKVVNLTLSNPGTGYAVATGRGTATLTIKDDDVAGAISFAADTFRAQEPTGPAGTTGTGTVTIVRTAGTAGCPLPLGPPPSCPDATVVTFATADNTAIAGTNYTATTTTVEFGVGETVKTVTVPLLSDGAITGPKTINLSLTNPQPAGFSGHSPTVGPFGAATLQIVETEIRIPAPPYGITPSYTGGENAGRITLTLVRTGDVSGTSTIDFATVDGTTVSGPGGDYPAGITGTVTFAPGESVQTLDVTMVDDSLFEGDESFEVVFSNPTGATIARDSCPTPSPAAGPAPVATCTIDVVIVDNDQGGSIEFSKPAFDTAENAGTATVTLKRTIGGAGCPLPLTVPTPPGGSCPGAVLATFSTADGTAVDGVDYTATTTVVEFGAGEVLKTVGVPVLDNTFGVRTANLSLSNATGGAFIGAQGSAVLRIIDANDSVAFTALGYTVPEAGGSAVVEVRRTGLIGNVVVNYVTIPGTATPGADYIAVAGALTLPPATAAAPITTRTILVPITSDAAVEPNEAFTVRLQGLSPITAVFDASGCDPLSAPGECDTTVTVIDDDQGGVIGFDKGTYEVAESSAVASILLRRTGGFAGPVTVTLSTSDGTAVAGTDYGTLGSTTPPSTTVTFLAGQTTATGTVPIINNGGIDATARTVNLAISNPQPGGLPGSPILAATTTAALTINDDEARVEFVTPDPTVPPTLNVVEGAPAAPIAVRRSGNLQVAVSVTIAASDASALAGTDYGTPGSTVPPSATLSFAPGETLKTFLLPIIDNALLDGTRTLNVTLSGAVNAGILCGGSTVASCTAPLTLRDDDRAGWIFFNASQYTVKEDAGTLTVTIARTGGKGNSAAVSYTAINDTAVNGTDYTGGAGSVTFLANETAKTVSIPVINRAGAQGSRRFFLVLCDGVVCGPPSTAPLLAPTQTAVTIVDKDAEQTVQFNAASYSVSEATAAATITLQRLGTPTGTLTVNFATADNTAVAPVDYQAVNTTVTFAAGVRTRTVTVPLRNNAQVEGDRTLTLTLSNMQLDGVPATGITCGGATGATCTVPLLILDDDVVGEVQFSAVTYQMAESAPSATITLLRSGGTAGGGSVEVVVDPPVVGRVGAPTPNPIVFGPGVTSRLVTIPIVPNTLVEGNIDVRLRLVNPQNGLVVGTRDIATLTIVEDDVAGAVQFAQAAYSVPEPPGPAGTTTTVMITLTRSGGTASGVTVDFATADPGPCPPPPGASYACAGTNYVATRGTLTFAAGQTSQTFPVVVMADALPTGSIPLTLTLSNPSSRATLGSRATAALTIVDVQAAVGFIAGAYAVAEGGSAVVTVERTGAAGLPGVVVVHYATSDGTATSLGATPDYRATAGNLTFNPGVRTLSFSVPTVGNVRQEGNRAFNVTLTPVSLGATTLVRSAATVTILDNDVAGVVAFVNGAVKAPSEFGAVNLLLHRPASGTAGPVTVDYRTVDGTAKANIDYVPVARTLTFGAGITDLTISVTILGNTRDDGNRAFTIELSSPTGGLALGTPSTASVLITDDDVAGTVQLSVASMTAATTCTVAPCKAAVTVKRFGGMASGVTVDWATVDGTGNAVNDYVPDTGTLSFGVSEFVKTIVVELRPGATVGSNFGVVLSHPQGGAKLGTVTTTTVTLR